MIKKYSKSNRTKNIAMAAMSTAVIAILSQTAIPLPGGVPITLATFAVALAGYFSGPLCAFLSAVVYLALGAVGLPIFTGFSGGIGHILGPSGGFILGYLPLALICGTAGKSKSTPIALLLGIIAMLSCHAIGILHFAAVTGRTVYEAFVTASMPFLIKDVISVAAAYFLAKILRRRLSKN